MDQQLDGYVAGEEVRLEGTRSAGQERLKLPVFRTPIIFRSRSRMFETFAQVDTIVIEPAERRFSLVARAAYSPLPNMLADAMDSDRPCQAAAAGGRLRRVRATPDLRSLAEGAST